MSLWAESPKKSVAPCAACFMSRFQIRSWVHIKQNALKAKRVSQGGGGLKSFSELENGTTRANAESCCPQVVHPHVRSCSCFFLRGGNTTGFLSRDAHRWHLISLDLVGAGRSVELYLPPGLALHHIQSSVPTPLQSCALQSPGRGSGGKDDPAHRGKRARAGRPLPPRAPSLSIMTYACATASNQDQNQNQTKKRDTKGKSQEGFLEFGCRLVYPHPTLSLSHSLKIVKSSKRVVGIDWHQSNWQSNQKSKE